RRGPSGPAWPIITSVALMSTVTGSPSRRWRLSPRSCRDRGDDFETTDIDSNFCHDRSEGHALNRPGQLVSCAQLHGGSIEAGPSKTLAGAPKAAARPSRTCNGGQSIAARSERGLTERVERGRGGAPPPREGDLGDLRSPCVTSACAPRAGQGCGPQ